MLVTHDPVEAMGMADRILLMRNGRLVQQGTPRELYADPVDPEAARFFSDFNEFTEVVKAGKVRVGNAEIVADGFADGQELTVMIRPQGIRPARQGDSGSIAGQVLEVRFLGDFSELWIQFDGIELPVLSRTALSGPVTAGEVRPFTIDRDHVVLFASDAA